MAQTSRHDVHRHTGKQQGRCVKMPQVMQPGVREQLSSAVRSHSSVIRVESGPS